MASRKRNPFSFRSAESKKKGQESELLDETATQPSSVSSSVGSSTTQVHASTSKKSTGRTVGKKFRELFSGATTPATRPATPTPQTPQPIAARPTLEQEMPKDTVEDVSGRGKLVSKRANEVAEEATETNDTKMVLLDLGIGAIDLLRQVSDVAGLVLPNPVGPVLEKVTAVLGTLKQMMENKSAWQHLLRTLDNHQHVFNQQLARLKKENLDADSTSPFLGPVKQYSMALEEILAAIIKESGLADKNSPRGGAWETVKNFSSKFINAGIRTASVGYVAADLTYLSEKHNLLPNNQFGGRPGRSTTEALHLLVQTVKAAWRAGDVVSILFLDIKAAFPNVVKPVLLNNMRLRGIPEEYVKFTEAMLTDRITRLSFDNFISSDFAITNGNGQGCPLSMIFYSFYIAPLLEVAKANKQESALGFVDDTSLMARGKDFAETHAILKDMMERADGCLQWSLTQNSPFEIGKLAVMDFTHSMEKKETSTDLQIVQNNTTGISTIKRTESYKLLGVCLDPKLNFHHHHNLVLARAVQWTALFRRINRMTKGLSLRFARQLYLAVAVPRITYAADVWYTPPHRKHGARRQSGKVGLTKKLDSIQRLAAIAITGAMNGVAGDVAALHASIPTSRFMLLDTCYKAVIRLSSRPKDHPLNQYIQRAARGQVRSHNTNLHLLLEMTELDPKLIEKIQPIRRHPNFKSHFDTLIIPDKEAALQWDNDHQKDECMIYTDGSGYEGGIGASAVLYTDGVKRSSLKFHLGTEEEHTVFEAELTGILLGLHLTEQLNHDFDHINFSLDNQAAIRDIHHRKPHPSHYLLDAIQLAAEAAHDGNRIPAPTSLSLTWFPGHSGAEGNEEADTIAKEAAEGASSPSHRLPKILKKALPLSTSAAKQCLKQRIKTARRQEWQRSSRFNRLNNIDPSLPSKKFLSLTADLTRAQASILTQLRTNHIPLNANLHRIKRIENPACPACQEADENINHFLFICPAYRTSRLKIERALKRSAANLETLLADKDRFQHLLRYIQETGRFQHLSKSLRPDPSSLPARAPTQDPIPDFVLHAPFPRLYYPHVARREPLVV